MSESILSNKRAVLSSAGVAYNDLYYSKMSSTVSLLECTYNYSQLISLPSLSFGSTSQINIPNDQFFGELILHLVLPPITSNDLFICRGWGMAMIQSINFTYGSSNTTQIMLQGDSIFQTIMSQITDPLKRLEVLQLAGQQQIGPVVVEPGVDTPTNEAFVLIPLPNSTMCDKLPIDTTMLQNNIQIQIQFYSDPRLIYGGNGIPPSSFLKAEVMLRQGKLSDQSKSARREMVMDSSLEYSYPAIYSQNFVTSQFPGVRESDGSGVQVDLNTFLNADLVGIMFYVIANEDKRPPNNYTPNPFNMDPITNVILQFAGQTLFQFPGKAYRFTNMLGGSDQSASYVPTSLVEGRNTLPVQSTPINSYPIFFDFSRLRSTCYGSHLFNTWRLTNQTLKLQFNTKYGATKLYKVYATFFYNSIIVFKNGCSAIFID